MTGTGNEALLRSQWGQQVAEARRRQGLTQVELAARTGRDPQTISRIERGRGGTLATLVEVASALEVNIFGEQAS